MTRPLPGRVLFAAALSVALAASVPAGSVLASEARVSSGRVVVDTGLLDRNDLRVVFFQAFAFGTGASNPERFSVEERNISASGLDAGPGCSKSAGTVRCAGTFSGGLLRLGARDDTLVVDFAPAPECFATFGPCQPDSARPTFVGPVVPVEIDAGTGDDDLTVNLPAEDTIFGDSGNDTIRTRDSAADSVFCGRGTDNALVDNKDGVAADCENVVASHVREAPNVRILGRRLRITPDGSALVRLRCPTATRGGCAGRLTVRRAGSARGRILGARTYARLRAGTRRAVRVGLRGRPGRAGARVTAVEQGRLGQKTTTATLG